MRGFESLLTSVVRKSHEIKSVFLDFSLSCPPWLVLSPVLQNSMRILEYNWWNLRQRAFLKGGHFGRVHTTLKEFENGRFHSENAANNFPSNTTSGKLKNATITGHFGFVSVDENSVRATLFQGSLPPTLQEVGGRHTLGTRLRSGKSHDYCDVIVLDKRRLSTLKHRASVFIFLCLEERFRIAPFSLRVSVNGRPNRRNKAK